MNVGNLAKATRLRKPSPLPSSRTVRTRKERQVSENTRWFRRRARVDARFAGEFHEDPHLAPETQCCAESGPCGAFELCGNHVREWAAGTSGQQSYHRGHRGRSRKHHGNYPFPFWVASFFTMDGRFGAPTWLASVFAMNGNGAAPATRNLDVYPYWNTRRQLADDLVEHQMDNSEARAVLKGRIEGIQRDAADARRAAASALKRKRAAAHENVVTAEAAAVKLEALDLHHVKQIAVSLGYSQVQYDKQVIAFARDVLGSTSRELVRFFHTTNTVGTYLKHPKQLSFPIYSTTFRICDCPYETDTFGFYRARERRNFFARTSRRTKS